MGVNSPCSINHVILITLIKYFLKRFWITMKMIITDFNSVYVDPLILNDIQFLKVTWRKTKSYLLLTRWSAIAFIRWRRNLLESKGGMLTPQQFKVKTRRLNLKKKMILEILYIYLYFIVIESLVILFWYLIIDIGWSMFQWTQVHQFYHSTKVFEISLKIFYNKEISKIQENRIIWWKNKNYHFSYSYRCIITNLMNWMFNTTMLVESYIMSLILILTSYW